MDHKTNQDRHLYKIENMNKFVQLLILCYICGACSLASERFGYQGEIACIDIAVDITQSDPLSELKSCFAIKLEANENSVFGDIRRLRVTADRIYILDSDIAESLFVFNREGGFLFKVGRKGGGPGEYYSINDFFIDTTRNEIIIYDANLRDLHYYNSEGNYIRTHSFKGMWSFACYPFDSTHYALDFVRKPWSRNVFHLQLVDQDNDVYFEYKKLKHDYHFVNNYHISFYNGISKTFYVPAFCDTIFAVSNSGIEGGYAVDFGKQKIPEEFFIGLKSEEYPVKLLKSTYCYGIKNVLETDKFLFFEFKYGNMGFPLTYNKESEVTHIHIQYLPMPLASYNNCFVGVLSSSLSEHIRSGQIEKKQCDDWRNAIGEANWNLLLSLKEEDNPLVFFYEFE